MLRQTPRLRQDRLMAGRRLGLRAEPQAFHWAILEGSRRAPILVTHDRAEAPRTYSEAQALAWCRDRLLQVIDEHKPQAVAIRYPEPISRGAGDAARRRCRLEGVLVEAAASRDLPITTGALATIGRRLGTKATRAKEYLSLDDFRGLDWNKVSHERREAILVGVGTLDE